MKKLRMKELVEVEKSSRGVLVVLLALWVSMVLVGAVLWTRIPPEVPWFYSLPWGEQRLVGKVVWAVIVASSGVIGLVNFFLGQVIGKGENLLRQLLSWGGVLIVTLVFLGMIRMLAVIL